MRASRLVYGLAPAVAAAGLLAAGAAPVQAAAMHDMELHTALYGSHAYPRAAAAPLS